MKNIGILVLFLALSIHSMAQDNGFKRFSIDARLDLWSPSDNYFKSSDIHNYNNFGYQNDSVNEEFSGYGSTISPQIAFNFKFTETFGLVLGFSYQHLLHEKVILNYGGGYPLVNFKNEATIYHIKIGFIGDTDDKKLVSLYYGFGIDIIPYYKIYYDNPYTYSENNSTKTSAVGAFFDLGGKINFTKSFSLKAGIEYTYIPVEIELASYSYRNLRIKSNFGGTGIHFGFLLNI